MSDIITLGFSNCAENQLTPIIRIATHGLRWPPGLQVWEGLTEWSAPLFFAVFPTNYSMVITALSTLNPIYCRLFGHLRKLFAILGL